METVYKLTTVDNKTRPGHDNETVWGEGVTHTVSGNGKLCSSAWLHAYHSPELAALMDGVHGEYGPNAKLWKCRAIVGKDNGDKLGCTEITTLAVVVLPTATLNQKRAFAIMVALEVYSIWRSQDKNGAWLDWAKGWLNGERSEEKRLRAFTAAFTSADAAFTDLEAAVDAAAYAVYADAAAASAAFTADKRINFVLIAQKAMARQWEAK